ncbi:MAG: trigger factor [Candidatus Aegiribacteria sp.]
MHDIVKSEGNVRTVRFTETAERINELFGKVRKQISRDLDLPGFRPGKVPKSIIDRQYGNIIKAEVADTVRQELTSSLLEEQDWILDDTDHENEVRMPAEGSPYSFEMTFSLFETPEPSGTDGITVEIPPLELEDAVDRTIESFREKMVSFEQVDRPAEEGDLVMLEADPAEEGGDPQVFSVRIGDSHIGEGFDLLVTGVEPGYRFSARMESDDPDEKRNPVHSFLVTEVRRPVLPELDDEFAEKAAGVENMEELRNRVEESVKARYEQEVNYLKERTVLDSLLKSNPFDPPAYMVNNLKRDYLHRLGEESPEDATVSAAEEIAEDKVREFLILRAVAGKEGIQVSPEEVEEEMGPEESKSSVLDRLRNARALELIIERADITEKEPEKSDGEAETSDKPGASWRWVLVEEGETGAGEDVAGEEGS